LRTSANRWLSTALILVGVHSVVLGILMLLWPLALMQRVGWAYEGSPFFPAQSGLFLLILGCVYLVAVRYRVLASVLVFSKAAAVVFLVVETAAGYCPELVYLTAVADGLMGIAVAVLLYLTRGADFD